MEVPANPSFFEEKGISQKANILIVDDNEYNLVALESVLRVLNQNIFKANSGKEALKLLLKHHFAVILLDVKMPEMDGFELASTVRTREKSSHIPIIFITANTKNEDIGMFKGYSLGAVDYIVKPIVEHILLSKISVFVELFKTTQHLIEKAKKLEQSKQLILLNKAKSEFLSMVSHEIRTPITVIMGYTQCLMGDLAGPLSSDQKTILQKILFASHNLIDLVNNVLDMSKLEAGKMELSLEIFDLVELIKNCIEMVFPLAEKKGIPITENYSVTQLKIYADPTKIRQCILNLLSNAIKFTETGNIQLSLHCVESDVNIHIQDSGIGMSPEELSKIFTPFTQADNSTSRKYGGSGLGLTISKRFIEMHGGRITVKSEKEKGSLFVLNLPISESHLSP